MCDPITLTIAATAVAAVGTGVKAISSANSARYQARVADANAKAASGQAADANERGRLDIQRLQQRNSQLRGQQRAALAANGIETDFGSAADIQDDAKTLGQQEVGIQIKNTEREVKGFDTNAVNYQAEARSKRQAATAALIGGAFDFGSTILGGVKQVSSIKAAQKGT